MSEPWISMLPLSSRLSDSLLQQTHSLQPPFISSMLDSSLPSSTSPLLVVQSLSNNIPAVSICTAWMVSSAVLTTYSTTSFLKYNEPENTKKKPQQSRQLARLAALPRPTLLTLTRFAGSLLLGLLCSRNPLLRLQETISAVPFFVFPAIFLFLANYMNSIALERIGISLTYTSKCGIPLITVLLTLLLDGPKALPNALALLSLLPIALGIGAASWSAPSFEMGGFLAAVTSTTAQSALNVSSKRAMAKAGVTGTGAQRVMVAIGLLLTIIMTFVQEHAALVQKRGENKNATTSLPALPPPWLAALASLSYHIEYVLSFIFVGMVQPITYGTCDAIRRLSIIMSGRMMFGGAKLTHINMIGIGLAILGALCYSVASSM